MLTLLGPRGRFCDGLSRRGFLTIGGLAIGGLSLPALLRAETQANRGRSHKSVIMVYLSGGLAHQDTFDLKPDAPAEIKGEFKPISTNVPGVQIGELLPRTARVMDKIALIRSLYGFIDEHSSWQSMTGFPMGISQREGKPHFGSVIARVQGPTDPVIPPYIDLAPVMQHKPYNTPGPGVVGRRWAGVKVDGDDVAVMKNRAVEADRFGDRRGLLDQLDQFRRSVDNSEVGGMESNYQKAFDVLTSSKLVEALDVTKEADSIRDRYGKGSPKHLGDGAPMWNDQLLMARRLVEAGARCVTVAYGFWDTHGGNFKYLKQHVSLVRSGHLGSGGRHLRPRPGSRRDGGGVGRVRADAEDQQGRRPRSLVAGQHGPDVRRRS